ncbi:GIY-YIG nuclease family protein [Paraburkholderia xenovorans]
MVTKSAPRMRPLEPLRLIEQKKELIRIDDIDSIPKGLRGIYVLYSIVESGKPKTPHRHVVYVGMSASGIKGRLRAHRKHKRELWDTCSIFVVWPNVRESEIRELEGILRHMGYEQGKRKFLS